jgi:hypothetical protein
MQGRGLRSPALHMGKSGAKRKVRRRPAGPNVEPVTWRVRGRDSGRPERPDKPPAVGSAGGVGGPGGRKPAATLFSPRMRPTEETCARVRRNLVFLQQRDSGGGGHRTVGPASRRSAANTTPDPQSEVWDHLQTGRTPVPLLFARGLQNPRSAFVQYGGSSRRKPCASTTAANNAFRGSRAAHADGKEKSVVDPVSENRRVSCAASSRSHATDQGQSRIPFSQSTGIPDGPTVAPAIAPVMAPVVSVSPPRRMTSSTARRKSPGKRNQQNSAAGTVW